MRPPTALLRRCYQIAYRVLRVYWFVRRPHHDGAKGVLTENGKVLLVRHTYGPAQWELPGGAVKRREPPKDAIGREVAEELGITVGRWTDLGKVRMRLQAKHETLHCYHAEVHDPQITLNRAEIAEAAWFASDALPDRLGDSVEPILTRLPQRG
jgi:8-oxo-dGTP pyrophosphatase MutT (NUDIX family)